jgi:hypothetical protein
VLDRFQDARLEVYAKAQAGERTGQRLKVLHLRPGEPVEK